MAQTIDVTGLSREAPPPSIANPTSVFELFGKAEVLRTEDEIAKLLRDERDS